MGVIRNVTSPAVARLILENGIPSEMPRNPLESMYRVGGRAQAIALWGDSVFELSFVSSYLEFAANCDTYRLAHGGTAPFQEVSVSMRPWDRSARLKTLRYYCLELHLLFGLRLMMDPFLLRQLHAYGMSPSQAGDLGSELWDLAVEMQIATYVGLLSRLGMASSYVSFAKELIPIVVPRDLEGLSPTDARHAVEENSRRVLEELVTRAVEAGASRHTRRVECPCQCGFSTQ